MNYERFVRDNNNVTWHNFNVVDNQPGPGSDPNNFVSLEFIAPGAPDRARHMSLEVGAALPQGSRLALEIPEAMYLALTDRGALTVGDLPGGGGVVRLRIPWRTVPVAEAAR